MSPRVLNIFLGIATAALIGFAIFQNSQLTKMETELIGAADSVAYFLNYSEELEADLASAQAELTGLRAAEESLQTEVEEVATESEAYAQQAQLYTAQKYYLAEVLDWFSKNYGLMDLEHIIRSYQVATNKLPVQGCEPEPVDRYVRWVATNSQIFVVTPDKMGWTLNTNWSIRENVVFGPDHHPDLAGYVGSRGYELRYPLVAGVLPQAEVHTTINAFETAAEPFVPPQDQTFSKVELHCGIVGYFNVSETDNSSIIYFTLGNYDVNVKLKYLADFDRALILLTQAANIVVDELTSGW